MYILNSKEYPHFPCNRWDGYYTGTCFKFNKENYACVDLNVEKAKKYKSFKIAQKACDTLNAKVVNYEFYVEELKDI